MSNMTGLTMPLAIGFAGQFLVGLPLLLPFKALHPPSIWIYHAISKGNGRLVGGTATAIGSLIMATSIWEAIGLMKEERQSDAKAEMVTLAMARAQISILLCAINVVLATTFVRLADEVSFHDRLKRSHAALQKQAGGLSEEYNRATAAMNSNAEEGPSNAELKQSLAGVLDKTQALQDKLTQVEAEKDEAVKKADQLQTQYKSLENSFDELMQTNIELKGGHKTTDKKAE